MSNLLESLIKLDQNDDIAGIFAFMQPSKHDPYEVIAALWHFLPNMERRTAFVLAMMLANAGHRHPIISIALAVGGLRYNAPAEVERGLNAFGLKSLARQIEQLSNEQQRYLHQRLCYPTLFNLLQNVTERQDRTQVRQVFDLLKAIAPSFGPIFDFEVTAEDWSLEKMRQQGQMRQQSQKRAKLITNGQPPVGIPRQPRRVVVATWAIVDEIGIRLAHAMGIYGWQVEHVCCTEDTRVVDGCRTIAHTCRQYAADILIITLDPIIDHAKGGSLQSRPYQEMIAQLRHENPAFKVVGILFDTWGGRAHVLMAELGLHLDLVWDLTTPTLPLWQEPAFAHKVLCVNLPIEYDHDLASPTLQPTLLFSGSVKRWNWPRAFWIAAMQHQGLPFKHENSSTSLMKGLPLQSKHDQFLDYMCRLTEATCCLNFSMRQNQDRIAVGRSFEVPLSGSLLVQEATEDLSCFFSAGEHYLEFATLAELSAIVQFIHHHKPEAEEIRRCGTAFARQHYSEEKIIGYIDKQLFYP